MNQITAGIIGALLAAVMLLALPHYSQPQEATIVGSSYADLYGNCQVTESKVAIGHQAATQLLAQSSSRQWAIVQQPLNATNTVALSFAGSAVVGTGYELPAATTSLTFGLGTDIRTGSAITARSSTGSTTVKVIQCDGRIRY